MYISRTLSCDNTSDHQKQQKTRGTINELRSFVPTELPYFLKSRVFVYQEEPRVLSYTAIKPQNIYI